MRPTGTETFALGLGVDHRNVVAEAVGDIERILVTREREAPGPFADQDVAQDFAGRYVDRRHMRGMAERHVRRFAALGHDDPYRRHVGLAHAGRQKRYSDHECSAIDNINFTGKLRRHHSSLPSGVAAIRRGRKPATTSLTILPLSASI